MGTSLPSRGDSVESLGVARRAGCRSCQPLIVLLVLLTLNDAHRAAAADDARQVLALYSTRRDVQISIVGDRELPRIFTVGLAGGVNYFSDYIDQPRFPDATYEEAFRDLLRAKYRARRMDAVVAMQDI